MADALSTAITTGLQAGAPLPELVAELRNPRHVPSGAATNSDEPQATPLSDYLARRLHDENSNTVPLRAHAQQTDVGTPASAQLPAAPDRLPHPRS